MGQSASTTSKVDVLNSQDLNISQNTYDSINQSCNNSGSSKNVLNVIGAQRSNLTTNQQNELKNLCLIKNTFKEVKDIQSQAKLLSDIEQKLTSKGGFPSASTDADQNVRNILKSKLSQDSYNNVLIDCIADLNSDNIINIVDTLGTRGNFSQTNSAYNKCVLDQAVERGLISQTDYDNSNKSSVEASSKAYDAFESIGNALSNIIGSIGGIFGSWVTMIVLVAVAFVIMIILVGPQLIESSGDALAKNPELVSVITKKPSFGAVSGAGRGFSGASRMASIDPEPSFWSSLFSSSPKNVETPVNASRASLASTATLANSSSTTLAEPSSFWDLFSGSSETPPNSVNNSNANMFSTDFINRTRGAPGISNSSSLAELPHALSYSNLVGGPSASSSVGDFTNFK